jgi:hypothetical protein
LAVLINANAEGYTYNGSGLPTFANVSFAYWWYRDTTAVQGPWCFFGSSPYIGGYNFSGEGSNFEHFSSQGTHVFRTIPTATWTFNAVTINGSTRTSYYANEGGTTLTSTSAGAWSSSSAQFTEFSLGFVNYFGDSSRGKLGHFRWWGATLSQSELEAELVSATAVRTSNLAGEYRFANGALTTDSSGNSRTLTVYPSSSPTFSADPTFPAAGGRRTDRLVRPRGGLINSTFY